MANPIPYSAPFGAALDVVLFESEAVLPTKAYSRSAAYDLSAYMMTVATKRALTRTISPQSTVLIPTGIGLRPPFGHVILICSRSGLAEKSVFVANGPGVVDPDYTGEIKVLLFNGGLEPCYVRHGDRIAQALVVPLASLPLKVIAEMPDTERGPKGFGSTGK